MTSAFAECRDPSSNPIGLYRDVWIAAIASSTTSLATRTAAICVRCQGRRVRRVYVTMEITFLTRKSALIYRRGLRQRVASLTLNCNGDLAIRAYMQGTISFSMLLFAIIFGLINPRNIISNIIQPVDKRGSSRA